MSRAHAETSADGRAPPVSVPRAPRGRHPRRPALKSNVPPVPASVWPSLTRPMSAEETSFYAMGFNHGASVGFRTYLLEHPPAAPERSSTGLSSLSLSSASTSTSSSPSPPSPSFSSLAANRPLSDPERNGTDSATNVPEQFHAAHWFGYQHGREWGAAEAERYCADERRARGKLGVRSERSVSTDDWLSEQASVASSDGDGAGAGSAGSAGARRPARRDIHWNVPAAAAAVADDGQRRPQRFTAERAYEAGVAIRKGRRNVDEGDLDRMAREAEREYKRVGWGRRPEADDHVEFRKMDGGGGYGSHPFRE